MNTHRLVSSLQRVVLLGVLLGLILSVVIGSFAPPSVSAQGPQPYQRVWSFELTEASGQGLSFVSLSRFPSTVTVNVYNPNGTLNRTRTVSLGSYETKTVYPGQAAGSGGWDLPVTSQGDPASDTAYGMVATGSEFFGVMLYPDEMKSGFGTGKTAIWAPGTATSAVWGHYNFPAQACNSNAYEYFFITNPGTATANLSFNVYKSDGTALGTNPRTFTLGAKQTRTFFLEADLNTAPGSNCDNTGFPGANQNIGISMTSNAPVAVSTYTSLGTAWNTGSQYWGNHGESAGVYPPYDSSCLRREYAWSDNKGGAQQTAARVTNPNNHPITVKQKWYTVDGAPTFYERNTTVPAFGTAELPAPTQYAAQWENEAINGKFRLFRTLSSIDDPGNPNDAIGNYHVHVTYDQQIDWPAVYNTDWFWGSRSPAATDELFLINPYDTPLTINVEYAKGGASFGPGQAGGTPIVVPARTALEWQILSDSLPPMTAPSIPSVGDQTDYTLHYYSTTAFPLHLELTYPGPYGDLQTYDCGGGGTGFDYGDAPDTGVGAGAGNYLTTEQDDGPHHSVTPKLYLGSEIDTESNGQPTTNADGDDTTGTPDDEDGVDVSGVALSVGTPASVSATVFNSSTLPAYLAGWIDWDGDGLFEASERVTTTVPSSASPQNVTLNFGTVPPGVPTSTYARFRIGFELNKVLLSTGWAGMGEVEDYLISGAGSVLIGDHIWQDIGTPDGVYSSTTDINLQNVPVTVTSSSGVTYTTVTNVNGIYTVSVPANVTYTVSYGVPSGLVPSATPAGTNTGPGTNDQSHSNGLTVPVTTTNNLNIDFALYAPPVLIGDHIWQDNGSPDGVYQPTDTNLPGVPVTVTSATGVEYTAVTDANGRYTVSVPANATYTVTYGTPAGLVPSTPGTLATDGSTNDTNHVNGLPVTVTTTDNLNIDFALFAPTPAIQVIKYTNGFDADTPTGPQLAVGAPVTWTYAITNTGNVTLTGVTLADDIEGGVTCPATELAAGAGMTCILTGTATAGQYANTAIVTGTPTLGPVTPVTDTNPSHYSSIPPVLIGDHIWQDNGNPDGVYQGTDTNLPGVPVTVTGSSGVEYTTVTDANGLYTVSVPANATYTVTYGTPAGLVPSTPGATATDAGTNDTNHVNGLPVTVTTTDNLNIDFALFAPAPGIQVIKYTNGFDADTPTGPQLAVGARVTWTYAITNTGNVTLTGVTLADDIEGSVTCPATELAPGAGTTCVLTGTATAGQYANTAIVTGTPTLGPVTPVTDTNPSHYSGIPPVLIGDHIWQDNGTPDGVYQPTDTNLPGVPVTVTSSSGVEYTAVTDANGRYTVSVPANATYTVTYATPAGLVASTPGTLATDGSTNDTNHVNGLPVTVTTADNLNIDFALFAPPVLIGDHIWQDNGTPDGVYQGTDTNLPGVPVTVTSAAGVEYTAVTDANGLYTVSVPANATYTVTYGTPAGLVPSTPGTTATGAGTNDTNHVNGLPVTVTTTDNLNIDFALFAPAPAIQVIKYTNGFDADSPTGPQLAVGAPVTWTYAITNTGNVTLTGVTLADDIEGSVTCPAPVLAPGAGMTCILTGTATAGQYANTAIVTGTPTLGPVTPVTDTNPSHYTSEAVVLIGDHIWQDNGNPDGVYQNTDTNLPGVPVTVTSATGVEYTAVTDANGRYTVSVPANATYTVTYGTPAGLVPSTPGTTATDGSTNDTNHVNGLPVTVTTTDNLNIDFALFAPAPGIQVIKYTNGFDADTPTGPQLAVGAHVTWTYAITNTGNVTLTGVTLADDVEGSVTCPAPVLAPGAGMTCILTGTATAGQYANTAIVTGTPTLGPVTPVTDTNPSHYTTEAVVLIGDHIWQDNGNPDGVYQNTDTNLPGVPVTVTSATGVEYTAVTDANGLYTVSVPANATYTVTYGTPAGLVPSTPGTLATDGSTNDTNHVNGLPVTVTTTDNLNIDFALFAPTPAIQVIKYTNGFDADTPTGPQLAVGAPVTWTYAITNTGNVTLTGVTLADDIEGGVTCPATELAAGAGMTCILTGTATAGQYANTAIVTGTPTLGPVTPVTDTNPSHYLDVRSNLAYKARFGIPDQYDRHKRR